MNARVSVEIETAQLPGGWMWRFKIPDDLMPEALSLAALHGWTGPFATEATAHDHARRSLEQLVRERIRLAQVSRAALPAPPPVTHRERVPKGAPGATHWTRDGDDLWSRRYPREDVKLEARVWRSGARSFGWRVTLGTTQVDVGEEGDPSLAKRRALNVMSKTSSRMRRPESAK